MLNIAKDMATPQGLVDGMYYEAIVVNNDDINSPDKRRLGRIQARVDEVFGPDIPDEHLPWAIPELFMQLDGASSTSGFVSIPKIGTKVLVRFQCGSALHPVYSGYLIDETTRMEELLHNYPNRAVARFQNGCLLVIDTQTDEVFFRNPGDLNIFIEGNANLVVKGNVVEKILGNKTTMVQGNLTEIVKGSRNLHVEGNNLQTVGGNNDAFAGGSDGHHASGNMIRTAPYINDDEPSGSAPSAPADPSVSPWPGIPGEVPS